MQSKFTSPVIVANIPEVKNFFGSFVYNFYTKNERTKSLKKEDGEWRVDVDKSPRYVALKWNPLEVTNFILSQEDAPETLEQLLEKLNSEDESLSPLYVSENFSDILSLQKGSSDFKNYTTLINEKKIDSTNKIKEEILKAISDSTDANDPAVQSMFAKIAEAYDAVADVSSNLLGSNIYNKSSVGLETTKIADKQDFFKNLVESLTLNLKIHKLALFDVFSSKIVELKEKELEKFDSYKSFAKAYLKNGGDQYLSMYPLKLGATKDDDLPVVKGYIVKRHRVTPTGIVLEHQEFIKNPSIVTYNDQGVIYGETYVYSINVVAELSFTSIGKAKADYLPIIVNFMSRPSIFEITCTEFTPPPPPVELDFAFNYQDRNLLVYWDFPVNTQHDIKQFQVFRRKSIKHPFELIKQYGFDDSDVGPNGTRYVTGELVDANNYANMREDLKYLVSLETGPVYKHIDKDFVVDDEFFETTSYIYALTSVDAHGITSNYSAQYMVSFDPFKNKINTKLVCFEGCPKAYPNLNLKIDTFKDSINTIGQEFKEIKVYFTPEYLRIQDEDENKFQIVEAKTTNGQSDPYYLIQMLNLDNQLLNSVRINIKDPENKSVE